VQGVPPGSGFPGFAAEHHYKDLDEGKWVRVDGWAGIDEARQEILSSVELFKKAPEKPNF